MPCLLPHLTFTLCLALSPVALRATSLTTADNVDPVILQSFLVEVPSDRPWVYLSGEGVEVLSRCPPEFNIRYMRALDKARRARLTLLPENYWGRLAGPVKMILYYQEPKRTGNQESGNPTDLSWASVSSALDDTSTLLVAHPAAVTDGDVLISCGNFWNVSEDSDTFSVDPDSEVRLRSRLPEYPEWFLSGMYGSYGIYATRLVESERSGDTLVIAKALWTSPEGTQALRKLAKEKRRGPHAPFPVPFHTLKILFGNREDAGDREAWDAEASLFVRWGLLAREPDGADHREAFLRFLDRCTREPANERLFMECFGLNYEQGEKRLRDYAPSAVMTKIRLPVEGSAAPEPVQQEASSAQIARILGTWGRLELKELGPMHAEFRQSWAERADRLFQRERARLKQDPLFQAEYGLYVAQTGNEQKARQELREALQSGGLRPRAKIELARLKLSAALPLSNRDQGKLSEVERAEILGLLAEARTQLPQLAPLYTIQIATLEHGKRAPDLGELQELRTATELLTHNSKLAHRVANLYRRHGYEQDAIAIARRALGFATTQEGKALLEGFLNPSHTDGPPGP